MSERVLAIGSHHDDIEIGCGGTLLRHRDAGDKICVAILKTDDNLTASVMRRQDEQSASATILRAEVMLFDHLEKIEDIVYQLDCQKPTVLYFPSAHGQTTRPSHLQRYRHARRARDSCTGILVRQKINLC